MSELRVGQLVRVIDGATHEPGIRNYDGLVGTLIGRGHGYPDDWCLDTAEHDVCFAPSCLIPINPDNEAFGSWEDMINSLTTEKVE